MENKIKSLREYIKEAEEKGVAIGHFNFSNLEGLHAIYNAAKDLNLPVILAVSEGEEKFVGTEEAVALVRALRQRDSYPIFLNADHHSSFESVKKCIDAGFDMAIIDCAQLSFDENVALTKKCVEYAHEIRAKTGRDILIEGELGYIGSGSNIKDSIPEGAGVLTTPEDAQKFVEMTGVDLLAPSVGSIHGLIKTGKPHINTVLVREIRDKAGVPLVLHGGSGLRDVDFVDGIKSGLSIVHINSEIRLAYKESLMKSLAESGEEITTAKILQPALESIQAVVSERLKLFNFLK